MDIVLHNLKALDMGLPQNTPFPAFLANVMAVFCGCMLCGLYILLVSYLRNDRGERSSWILVVMLLSLLFGVVVWLSSRLHWLPASWNQCWPVAGTVVTLCLLVIASLLMRSYWSVINIPSAVICCAIVTGFSGCLGTASAEVLLLPRDVILQQINLVLLFCLGCLFSAEVSTMLALAWHRRQINSLSHQFRHVIESLVRSNHRATSPNDRTSRSEAISSMREIAMRDKRDVEVEIEK